MAKIKAHSLTGRITSVLMRHAFRNVRRNRGVAGIDKISITMFEANLEQKLLALMEDGVFRPTKVGTPQGGVISPLLANITLNSLDWHLQLHGQRFVRYADDF